MESNSADLARVMASLQRDKVALHLETIDLCYLIALHTRAERAGLVCFSEDVLLDEFEQVADVVAPDGEQPRKSATHAIQRLREQRLLSRVDGAGILRAGEYALTRLAATIVDFYRADQALTRESLTLLTKELIRKLSEIKKAASKAKGAEAWRSDVLFPLNVVVSEMVGGIERRQRGLDKHQEEVQQRIGDLLVQEWTAAICKCEGLLEETAGTLKELNTVLMHDSNQIQSQLDAIQALAEADAREEVSREIQLVSDQVDRIAAWGSARQHSWSDYYEYVHRYLRDYVRLDPKRAVSERLRKQLATFRESPFGWVIAGAVPIRLLRDGMLPVLRAPLARPRCERETPLAEVAAANERAALERGVKEALGNGCTTLSGVLTAVLPSVPKRNQFVATGRITQQVAIDTDPLTKRECDWVEVPGRIEVEEWTLRNKRK